MFNTVHRSITSLVLVRLYPVLGQYIIIPCLEFEVGRYKAGLDPELLRM